MAQLDTLLDQISPNSDAKTRHIHRTASKAFLYILLGICNGTPPAAHTFTMRSTVPIGAGLGSSASIAVCIATAALRLTGLIGTPGDRPAEDRKREADVINHWAFIGEMIMHGTPSGVDNTVSTFGMYDYQNRSSTCILSCKFAQKAYSTSVSMINNTKLTNHRQRSPLQTPLTHKTTNNNTRIDLPNPALTRREYAPVPQHKCRSRKSQDLPITTPLNHQSHPRRHRQPNRSRAHIHYFHLHLQRRCGNR